ncbi:hypothetical protein SAMN04487947_3000 [Halogeometricum rufum]|jgi:hypothetical protein|uniref:DUF5518 domain-containing protein n=1 Tax=Halogeometricum rufum TaxID=553469 RepID=A0A1I6I7K9_9EURY|nr:MULTISPECIES: DUF5518 domain-containing protein [Halogeometricum]MUV56347.1 hypothetical protein [Halogeometricum sp. CBA1124]SFR62644.1 hypothetical protein SAMN04487947_3000 [Halogeometricum rufum]
MNTDWRAVAVGFVVILVVGAVGLSLPLLGQIGAGLVGGFAAGYLAGGTLGDGAWNGLLAGSISGVVLTLVLALLGSVLGLAGGPLGAFLGGAGVFLVGLVVTVLFAVDSAIAGAIGSWAKAR